MKSPSLILAAALVATPVTFSSAQDGHDFQVNEYASTLVNTPTAAERGHIFVNCEERKITIMHMSFNRATNEPTDDESRFQTYMFEHPVFTESRHKNEETESEFHRARLGMTLVKQPISQEAHDFISGKAMELCIRFGS